MQENELLAAMAEIERGEYVTLEELLQSLPKYDSDAIRAAVQEALERERRRRETPDFSQWVGLGTRAPENSAPRFCSDDDLWS